MSAIFDTLENRGYLNPDLHAVSVELLTEHLRNAADIPDIVKVVAPHFLASLDTKKINSEIFTNFLKSVTPDIKPELAKLNHLTVDAQ